MKIAVSAQKFAALNPTGVERYSADLISHLAEQVPNEVELTLYLAREYRASRVPHVSYRLLRPSRLWSLSALPLALLRDHPDLVFIPANILPPLLPVPAVTTVHDLGWRAHPEAYSSLTRLVLEYSTRRAVRLCRRLICISNHTRSDLISLFGADPKRVEVIYPIFVPSPLKGDLALLRPLRLRADSYFLFLGRIEKKKNLVTLIRAFAATRHSGKLLHRLVLAGAPGEGSAEITAEIANLGLLGEIILPGYVSEKLKGALLKHATALVLPSLYEGFGYPILEAYAARIPVVSSTAGPLPEVAGKGALLFDPPDVAALTAHLTTLATDKRTRERLIRAGDKELTRFNPRHSTEKLWRALIEAAQ